MSVIDRLTGMRGSRTQGLGPPGVPRARARPGVDSDGLEQLAADLGVGYEAKGLVRDAVERDWEQQVQELRRVTGE